MFLKKRVLKSVVPKRSACPKTFNIGTGTLFSTHYMDSLEKNQKKKKEEAPADFVC